MVHWRYRDDVSMQVADAIDWLRDGEDRYLLVGNEEARPCLGDRAGQWIGFRHRQDWQLVTADDIPENVQCNPAGRPVTRFVAPYIGYPRGPG